MEAPKDMAFDSLSTIRKQWEDHPIVNTRSCSVNLWRPKGGYSDNAFKLLHRQAQVFIGFDRNTLSAEIRRSTMISTQIIGV